MINLFPSIQLCSHDNIAINIIISKTNGKSLFIDYTFQINNTEPITSETNNHKIIIDPSKSYITISDSIIDNYDEISMYLECATPNCSDYYRHAKPIIISSYELDYPIFLDQEIIYYDSIMHKDMEYAIKYILPDILIAKIYRSEHEFKLPKSFIPFIHNESMMINKLDKYVILL